MRFDLLLKGGHLIDQPSGYDGVLDLAVKRHRIAAVAADIPAESAAQVLDLSGQYVVPGLVDLHSHVYRGATAFGIDAENLRSRTGVTTWVDCKFSGDLSPDDCLPSRRRIAMPTPAELCTRALTEVATLLRTRAVSPVELTQALLDRITTLDPRLHSYLTVTADRALADARAAEREIGGSGYRGPLHGIPLGIKDLCDTAGVRTTCASAILASRVPTADATVVARLRAAGAVLLGKLSLTEFAYGGYHPTTTPPVNPWAPDRWPGASSSGSGVAVAAGLAFGALGSDTGGSIRFPSAACGIVGLKPTYGRVSRAGVFPLAETLDHIGPMTRTVADAAALLSGIAGFDSSDPTSRRDPVPDYAAELVPDLRGVRIGVDEAYVRTDTEPEVAEAVLAATAVFRDAGAEIREIGGAVGIEAAARDWYVVCAAEAAAAHAPWFPTRAAEYGPTFRALLEDGTRLRATEYVTVDLGRQRVRRQIEDLWQAVDCLLCPSMPTLPPTVADFRSDAVLSREAVAPLLRFTAPFDFSGSPTLSVPCGVSRIGLPLSLQLVGRHGDEALLLRAGHAYETATPWTRRRPPI